MQIKFIKHDNEKKETIIELLPDTPSEHDEIAKLKDDDFTVKKVELSPNVYGLVVGKKSTKRTPNPTTDTVNLPPYARQQKTAEAQMEHEEE